MYNIISKTFDATAGKWKVQAAVSAAETMFLWFTEEPTQEDIDRVIVKQLPIDVVVETVTMKCLSWQLCKALNRLSATTMPGLRANLEYLIANSGDQDVIDGWQKAPTYYRYDPLVMQFGSALGLTEAQLDDLFILAASL